MHSNGWCWASFFVRWVLGLIFLMAGYFKVFDMTAVEHARRFFVEGYADTWIPQWLLWATGYLIPFVELFAGALLCLGFRTRYALVAIGGVLVVVTYGHLLKEPLFSITGHILPRLSLMVFLFLVPPGHDRAGIDHWLARRRGET